MKLHHRQARAKLSFLLLLLTLVQCLKLKQWVQAQAVGNPSRQPSDKLQLEQAYPANQLNQANKQTTTSNKQEQIRQKLFNLNEADENGIYLLGLFDIHSRPSGPFGRSPFGCGPIDVDAGEASSRRAMQNMWAFLWAIDQVNQDETLLPGVRLGSLVLDTCSSELQTSQQLANLLHGHHEWQLPRANQFAGLVADQRDWRSVEASASIASSLGLTTFVTQTRSTKLNEQQAADQARATASPGAPNDNVDAPLLARTSRQMDERLLGGLLGIGNMMTGSNLGEGQPLRDLYAAATANNNQAGSSVPAVEEDRQELRLIKMLPGNEMLADALASLCDQMKWDLISVVYDGAEPDLIDLHDELIRELFLRNTQLALDEQLNGNLASLMGAPLMDDPYERLLLALARKSQIGSRVVISLLSIQSARKLQAKLNELRGGTGRRLPLESNTLKQLNSLQWITITDREPYYSYPTDSLGVISVSSSSSLMPEFKHYYDHLKLVEAGGTSRLVNATSEQPPPQASDELRQPNNKWWPEYMRALMMRRREQLGELLAEECAKWLEPSSSPLHERCRKLDLASLADLERRRPSPRDKLAGSSAAPRLAASTSGLGTMRRDGNKSPGGESNKLARYLASGWDHNGMDVINSVLAIANGLESIRQSLCSNATVGLCAEMRQLVASNEFNGILEHEADQQQQQQQRRGQQPTLSELVQEELMKLTFQLVDGQMFRLNQSPYSAAVASERPIRQQHPAAVAAATGDDLTLGLLASGFLPVAQEHSRTTQLDARLKFYNLRFLRPNSIGFVKFAQFSQEDGLTWQANQSQALHYSSIPSNFSDQTPIKEVKSSCSDETKCLILSAFVGSAGPSKSASGTSSSSSHLNEEQLAAGFNSLFKLDHPLISSGSENSNPEEPRSAPGSRPELARVRTMRSRAKYLSVPLSDPFQPTENSTSGQQQQQQQAPRRRQFEVIVLLPLHKSAARVNKSTGSNGGDQDDNNQQQTIRGGSCGGSSGRHFRLDETHSFQQLAALAYAQQLANGHLELPKAAIHHQQQQQLDRALTMTANASSASSGSQMRRSQSQSQAQSRQQVGNELVISVIDYCGQIDLVEESLLALLRSRSAVAKQDEQPRLVGVVDFDSRVGQLVERALTSGRAATTNHLLHVTIARQATQQQQQQQLQDGLVMSDQQQKARAAAQESRQLRINLLPSKTKEIEALLSVIKSFPSWRLVHLIYTDSHEFRDEFVRRANEANICVSKLIWIPQVEKAANEIGENGGGDDNNEADLELSGRLGGVLEKTRQLFKRELYDFSQQDAYLRGQQTDNQDSDGLNSTRVLVVLASSSDATNRLILEAASQSMLDDYVWLTTHEWLKSVELPFERVAAASAQDPTATAQVAQALPRHFLSTKMESFEGHHFKEYFSHLLPALHEPIPADWFDEFWQQHFKCRLPSSFARGGGESSPAAGEANRDTRPDCNYSQRLDWERMRDEDDLVPYTIRAVESLQVALSGYDEGPADRDELTRFKELSRDFRLAFDLGTREIVGNAGSSSKRDPASQSLVGFHIVHRLQATSRAQQDEGSMAPGSNRRTNSRQLAAADSTAGQLVRVGLWRDHYQLKHGSKLALASFGKRRSMQGTGSKQETPEAALKTLLNDRGSVLSTLEALSNDSTLKLDGQQQAGKPEESAGAEQEMSSLARSLDRLAAIKSRCSNNQTCTLCKRQIGLTMSLIMQEETRLNLKERPNEPKAISGNSMLVLDAGQRLSSLDGPALSNFDDDDADNVDDENDNYEKSGEDQPASEVDNKRKIRTKGAVPKAERRLQGQSGSLDEIQAAASSLFDSRTSQQVASDTRRAYRHYASHHNGQAQYHSSGGSLFWPETAASGLRRHSGALLSVLSLIGVAFTVATMTYFYPNMLEGQAGDHQALTGMAPNEAQWRRVKKFNQSQRSTSSSQCNIILDEDEELNRILGQMRPGSFLASILANIADYLMLTALLMLYSINVAFLLPAASVGVCWLRRIGLTLSYTLLFAAILAKIQEIHRRQKPFRGDHRLKYDSNQQQHHHRKSATTATTKQAAHQSLEPVEENVEVTFESLTYENNNNNHLHEFPNSQESSNAVNLNEQQQHNNHQAAGSRLAQETNGIETGQLPEVEAPGGSLKLPVALILAQLGCSLVWLVKQPPEPTLHQHTCWHCASLARSPVLFLYEPLLSLIGPALILAVSWLWSIVLFNRASASDSLFARAMKRLIVNQPLSFTQMQNPNYLRLKQKQLELADQLRDSKLLVITTTLLVLLWASATLSLVSSSQASLRAANAGGMAMAGGAYKQQLGQHAGDDGQSLVYTNIISGVIVFSVLFIYRLNWLFGCIVAKKARKCHYDQISSSSSFVGVMGPSAAPASGGRRRPFRLFRGRRGSKMFLENNQRQHNHHQLQQQPQQMQPQTNTGDSQQANVGSQERLKLQHFSMTYGTYSATGSLETGSGSGDQLAASNSQRDTQLEASSTSGCTKLRNSKGSEGQQAKQGTAAAGGSKSKSIFKLRKSTTSRSSSSSTKGATGSGGAAAATSMAGNKLQRRQSNGSVASSQAKLMRRFSEFDLTDDDDDVDELSISGQHQLDTISCAMSVASNSTSQLQGNDLYPIDCSIQLDSQPAGIATTTATTSASTMRPAADEDRGHKLATVEL